MKKPLILMVIVFLTFSFLFTGCEEDPATTGLTDEEVMMIAMGSVGSCVLPIWIMDVYPDDGPYTNGGMIVGGSLEVSEDGTIYTFDACEIDMDGAGGAADVTLDGVFHVEVNGATTITFTDFYVTITPPDTTDINIILAATLTITATEFNANITLSGITAAPCTVVVEMTMAGGYPVEVTLATINGVDYTDEFNDALDAM
jgi:hypothetical protein